MVNFPAKNPYFGMFWSDLECTSLAHLVAVRNISLKEVARGGWGANPGPHDFIYFRIFTTLPLSHSSSPHSEYFTNIT
jgi:hypothetical protein